LVDTFEPHTEADGGEIGASSKRYTAEFRAEAVKQVIERGHPVREVAAQLLAERLVTAVGDAGPTALPAGLFMLTAVFGCPDSRHQETTS